MSLKGGINTQALINTIKDVQYGKKGACERLYKYVEDGEISHDTYNELIEQYGIKREENKNPLLKKKESKFCAVASVAILFVSMLCGLAYMIEQYGEGAAVLYIFLWVWALSYALSN